MNDTARTVAAWCLIQRAARRLVAVGIVLAATTVSARAQWMSPMGYGYGYSGFGGYGMPFGYGIGGYGNPYGFGWGGPVVAGYGYGFSPYAPYVTWPGYFAGGYGFGGFGGYGLGAYGGYGGWTLASGLAPLAVESAVVERGLRGVVQRQTAPAAQVLAPGRYRITITAEPVDAPAPKKRDEGKEPSS